MLALLRKGEECAVISAIAGNLGAGKSTLAERLKTVIPNVVLISEELENPHFIPFYKHITENGLCYNKFAFPMQKYFLEKRLEGELATLCHDGLVVSDRFLDEYFHIFVKNCLQTSLISEEEYSALERDYQAPQLEQLLPHVVYYLKCGFACSKERVKQRGREAEADVLTREYFNALEDRYAEFAEVVKSSYPQITLVEIDTESLTASDLSERVLHHLLAFFADDT